MPQSETSSRDLAQEIARALDQAAEDESFAARLAYATAEKAHVISRREGGETFAEVAASLYRLARARQLAADDTSAAARALRLAFGIPRAPAARAGR